MDQTIKLFEILKRDGYYTRSLEEFKKQFQDPKYQDKVFNVVSRERLFTKSKEDFLNQFVVKKKDISDLPSGDGSSDLPISETETIIPGSEANINTSNSVIPETVVENTATASPNPATVDMTYRRADPSNNKDYKEINVAYEQRESGNLETLKVPKGLSKFEEALFTINEFQIDQEEEESSARLNYLFNDFGYTFEQGGGGILMGMDSITVTAPNKKKKSFNLDPVFGDLFGGETSVAKEMKEWMRNNQTQASREQNIILSNDDQYRVYYSMQGVQSSINNLQKKENAFKETQKSFLSNRTAWIEQQQVYQNASNEQFNDPVFKAEYDAHVANGVNIDEQKQELVKSIEEFTKYKDIVVKEAGRYVDYKSSTPSGIEIYPKQMWNAMTNTVGGIVSSAFGIGTDILGEGIEILGVPIIPGLSDIVNAFGLKEGAIGQTDQAFQEDYLKTLKENNPDLYAKAVKKYTLKEGLDFKNLRDFVVEEMNIMDSDNLSYLEAIQSGMALEAKNLLGGSRETNVEGKFIGKAYDEKIAEAARDQFVKRIKLKVKGRPANAKDSEGNLVGYEAENWTGLRNILTDYIGFSDLSEEKDFSIRNRAGAGAFVWKGILGGVESLPALVTTVKGATKKNPVKTANKLKKMFIGAKDYLLSPQGMQRSLQMSGFIVDGLNKELESNPEFQYVSEQQKKTLLLPIAITSSALEVIGFRNIETGMNFTGAALKMALGQTGRRTTAKEFSQIVTDVVTNPYKKVALRTLAAGVAEFETGLLQQLSESEIKRLYDLVNNNEFNTPAMWTKEYVTKVLQSGLLEAIGGAALGSVAGVYEAATSDGLQQVSDEMFELYNSVVDDENFKSIYVSQLKQDVILGDKTQAEADVLLYQFNQLAGIKGRIPNDMSIENKKKSIALLLRKQELTNQIEGKDESLTQKTQREIDAIDQKMLDLATETAQEVIEAEEATKGITVEVTEEEAIAELNEEGVESPTKKQIKEKINAIQERSTETLDAQESTESSSEVGENVFIEGSPAKDKTNPKTKGKNKKKTKKEIKEEREQQEDADLEKVLGETSSTEEKVGDNVTLNVSGKKVEKENNQNRKQKSKIIATAKRAGKFLRKKFPNVKITLYENSDAYTKARGKTKGFTSVGFYNPKNGKIGINVSVAAKLGKTGVIAHEVAHAVLIETLKKTGASQVVLTRITKRLVDAVYKSGKLSNTDKQKIEKFVEEGKYQENVRDEEKFAEIISLIANNFNSFSPANKSKIRQLLDRMIDALPSKVKDALQKLGFNVMTASDQELVQFLETLGGKIGAGVEATDADTKVLDKLVAEESQTREFEKQINQSKKITTRDSQLDMFDEYLARYEARQLAKEKKLAKEKSRQQPKNKKSLGKRRYEFANMYQMRGNGLINNLNFNFEQFVNEAAKLNLVPVPTYNEVTGQLNGYYFTTIGGSYVNPMKVKSDFNMRQSRVLRDPKNFSDNILEDVKTAIDNGFTNDTIKRYLKTKGYSLSEINDVLAIATKGIFETLPKSFMNIPGGIKSGLSLMFQLTGKFIALSETNRKNNNYNERLEKKAKKGTAAPTWYLKLRPTKDATEIMNEVVEYMKTLPEYRKVGADSSLAILLERDVMLALNPTPNNYNAPQVRVLTAALKSKRIAQLEIKQVQMFLRNFMRTVLPRDIYGKGEVMSLIDKVNGIKTQAEVPAVVEEVMSIVTDKANQSYMTSIFNILNRKTLKIESGRYKGKIISEAVRNRIKDIGKMITDPETGFENIKKRINELEDRRAELETKADSATELELQELGDISIALIINNAFMSNNDNSNKTEQLMDALSLLTQLELEGRTEFKAELEAARLSYRKNLAMAWNEITAMTINWKDLTYEEAYDVVVEQEKGRDTELGKIVDKNLNNEILTTAEFNKLRKAVENKRVTSWSEEKAKALSKLKLEREDAPVKSKVRQVARNVKEAGKKLFRALDLSIIGTAEDLSGLMDRVLKTNGELFGGPLMTFVTDAVRSSTREYKRQRRLQQGIFFQKYEEIYGKKWKKAVRKNAVITPQDIYYNKKANETLLEQKEKIKNSNATERTKKDLLSYIDKQLNRNQLQLSQNQMFYLYNQFKDPALRYKNGKDGQASRTLENTFAPNKGLVKLFLYDFDSSGNLIIDENGEFKQIEQTIQNDAAQVLANIELQLDPRVKEWADWQTEVYYPSVYTRYNDMYKKIYRTSMPANQYYGGRLYREAPEDAEAMTVLPEKNSSSYLAIAPQSTKSRLASDKAIHFVDGDNMLINYVRDMEYFAAYADTIRDIHKVFSDPTLQAAITELHGNDINKYINDSITKIANKGSTLGVKQIKWLNALNTTFLLARLGANLTLVVKQLTSIPTYGNDIGYVNWIKYAGISLTKIQKTYNEMMENSVVLQDRYGYNINVDGKKVYVKSTPIQKNIENYEDQKLVNMLGGVTAETIENITKYLMFTTMVGDRGAILIGGMPNYLYHKEQALKAGKTEAEAIQVAVIKFEKDTLKTQQSYDLQDKDYYQTSDPISRAFNMFLTTPKQYFRREVVAMRNLYRKLAAWDRKAGRGSLAENTRTFILYHFVMPMLFEYASQGFPGMARAMTEDDKKELGMAALLGNLNAIFIYGQALEAVIDYNVLDKSYGSVPQSLPILESAAKLQELYKRMTSSKKQETRDRNTEKFYLELAQTFGIPAAQIKKIWGNYSQLGKADGIGDAMLLIMGFSEYMRKRGEVKTKDDLTEAEKRKYIPGYKQRKDQEKRRIESSPAFRIQEQRRKMLKRKEAERRELMLRRRYGGRN